MITHLLGAAPVRSPFPIKAQSQSIEPAQRQLNAHTGEKEKAQLAWLKDKRPELYKEVNDAVAKLNSPALTAYNTANPAVVSR